MNRNQQNVVYLQSGDPETELRVPDGYSGGQLGSLLTVADPNDYGNTKQYRLVQADSIMDVLPSEGAVAYWLDRQAFLVTTDVSAGRGNPAGIFRRAATAAELLAGAVMCVQRRGKGTVQPSGTGTPSTVGLFIVPSATDAVADTLTAGTAPTYPKLGVAVSATAAGLFTAQLDVDDGMAEG